MSEAQPTADAPQPPAPRFDLFGDPVPDGWGRRGRPEHIATNENRDKVLMLLALGWSNERIASALGITPPTLRKAYRRELKLRGQQRDRLNAAIAMRLWQGVQDGNISAVREFEAFLEKNDLMNFGQASPPDRSAPEKKLGKKEAALAAAQKPDAGTPLGELMARRQGEQLN